MEEPLVLDGVRHGADTTHCDRQRLLVGAHMPVRDVHERVLDCAASGAGHLIDTLSSADDQLWPHEDWPAMRLDRPLGVGARGGHGPIRYRVSDYRRGRSVRFAFDRPRGFHGYHEFEVVPAGPGTCALRHTLSMDVRGRARFTWPLVIRPLHEALVEDALHKAQVQLGCADGARPVWRPYVRLLRAAWPHAARLSAARQRTRQRVAR